MKQVERIRRKEVTENVVKSSRRTMIERTSDDIW